MTSRSRQAGFTLIEMIVVLVVLGLVLGLVVTRGPVRSRALEARAAASRLAAALRNARGEAIVANRPVTLVLDVAQHSYRVDRGSPTVLPPEMALSVIAASGETLGGRLGGITFEPDGSSSGGRIEIRDGTRRMQVGIDWLTGRVSIADAK